MRHRLFDVVAIEAAEVVAAEEEAGRLVASASAVSDCDVIGIVMVITSVMVFVIVYVWPRLVTVE